MPRKIAPYKKNRIPPKVLKQIVNEIPLSKEEVIDCFSRVLRNSVEENKKLASIDDDEFSIHTTMECIAASALLGKHRFENMMMMLDRILGKPKTAVMDDTKTDSVITIQVIDTKSENNTKQIENGNFEILDISEKQNNKPQSQLKEAVTEKTKTVIEL